MPAKAVDLFPSSPGSIVTGYQIVEWLLEPAARARYGVGLLIWRHQYWSARTGWVSAAYHGSDPHESHVHVSVGGCI